MKKIKPYIQVSRPDHWIKNIFAIPGIAVAIMIYPNSINLANLFVNIFLGLISVCIISSANYTINEFLDAKLDRLHPQKKMRPAAQGLVTSRNIFLQYFFLSSFGLLISCVINSQFFYWSIALLIMGLVYNVRPVRAKDRAYIDVLVESVNNPIRLLLGWYMVTASSFPPSSLLLSYWMGGAFLMTLKRFSELRYMHLNKQFLVNYRPVFSRYSELSLLLASFYYAISSSLFLGIFLIKHKIEFILLFPAVGVLFSWYLFISHKENSAAQFPEKLYKEKGLFLYIIIIASAAITLLNINLDFLRILLE
jgi:decaprenyl-phosphate phosphoribosyltransferase